MNPEKRTSWLGRFGLATALSFNGCVLSVGSYFDVHIEQPSSSSSFTTSQDTITLSGSLLVGGFFGDRREVDWANASTGDAGFGTLQWTHWICGPIPLEAGPNLLKVHASAIGSGSDTDSITVTYMP